MSVLALHHHPDEGEVRRYGAAAIAIVLLHVAVIAAALVSYQRPESAGVTLQPIFVDLAPAPAAQKIQTEELPPGPQIQEAQAPPPEPPKAEMVEQLQPTPPQPAPVVAAPEKIEPKPTPAKPQPIRDHKKPLKKQLVEQSTAARADRIAPEAPAPSSGANAAAAAASYRSILAAHLQRFKRAHDGSMQGKALVTFTVTRNGQVTSSRLARSSGFAALDQQALALIQRAQPLPPFPPEMREVSTSVTVPFDFTPR